MRMNANVQVRGGEMALWRVLPFLCQRVSAVAIVHTFWALDVCPHVSRQLFSTAVLMESPGPRAPFNVGLTTFHIFLPKQIMLYKYLSCV